MNSPNEYKKMESVTNNFKMVEYGENHAFVYDSTRNCTKLCLCIKTTAFAFYAGSAFTCTKNTHELGMYCGTLVAVCLAIANMVRYEYAFYKMRGTVFLSHNEYRQWKTRQHPNWNVQLDVIETVLKLLYLVRTLPFTLTLQDDDDRAFSLCNLGISVFKIHLLLLFTGWTAIALLFVCIYMSDLVNRRPGAYFIYAAAANNQNNTNHNVNTTDTVIDIQTECCICLDKTADVWTITRCAHSFHRTCLSNWTHAQTTATCPVCRTNLVQSE